MKRKYPAVKTDKRKKNGNKSETNGKISSTKVGKRNTTMKVGKRKKTIMKTEKKRKIQLWIGLSNRLITEPIRPKLNKPNFF